MKLPITIALGVAALTAPSVAQDLNAIKDTALRSGIGNNEFWTRPISDGTSQAVLNVCQYGSLTPIGTIPLPVDRVGDMIWARTGTDVYRALVIGSVSSAGSHALPDVDGVAAILEIDRNGGAWTTTILDIEIYDDIDPWATAVHGDEVFFLDYRTGSIFYSSDFELSDSAADVPSRAQLELAFAGTPSDPDFMASVPASRLDFEPISSGSVLLKNLDEPRQIRKIAKGTGGSWTSTFILDTFAPADEIQVRDFTFAGNGHGLEVKVISATNPNPGNLVVRDPNNQILFSQIVTPGSWVTLPPIAALAAEPGERHTLEFGSTKVTIRPTVRYGNSASGKAGFSISKGLIAQPYAGIPFEHGVRVHADASLANEVVTVFALYALRDPMGQDPVLSQPNGDFFLVSAAHEVFTNVRLGDLNGSLGSQFAVPPSTQGIVVLLQYAVVFQDGSMAYSDVFGSKVQTL